jgi:hypothetical protein
MANDHKDYSGTPLPKKLGIREGSRVMLVGAPDVFERLLTPIPDGVRILKRAAGVITMAMLFRDRQAGSCGGSHPLVASLDTSGRLWVAWPRKVPKGDHGHRLPGSPRGSGLDAGLVDNRASITEVYRGLQFVYRSKDRRSRRQYADAISRSCNG